jgi:hypothetical protein
MGKKTTKTIVIDTKKFTLTTCFLTSFFPCTAFADTAKLTEVNNNLQSIFSRMKQKYAEHDAQQAQLAAQAEAARSLPSPASTSQTIDAPEADSTSVTDDFYAAPNENESRFAAGEELILNSTLNGIELASIFAVKSKQGLHISLSEFLQITELPIYVDIEQQRAEGWFQKESNKFTLNKQQDGQLRVQIGSKNFYVAEEDYSFEDDLYIELNEVIQWFGLDSKLDEGQLKLVLTSKSKLPVESRLARLNAPKKTPLGSSPSTLPLQESSYKAFSPPMLDIQVSAQEAERVYPRPVGEPETTPLRKDRQSSAGYSILASHDLAFLNAELFLSGNDQDSLNSARLTMSRQSDQSDLLGPLRATEYAFGDVTPVNAGLGTTRGQTLGFSFGNTPINQLADNRKVNITGEIQAGWDVELYRNGLLIDQRLGVSDGRYEFNDTLLEYGNNDFELLFYGPQGQIESKKESYIVDSNTVRNGEGMYRFSLVEVGESVFDLDNHFSDPTKEGTLASTVLDLGVTDWLAFSLGSSVFEPKEGETQSFVNLGAHLSMGKAGLLSSHFQRDKYDLNSFNTNYRTRFFDTSYSLDFLRREGRKLSTDETYNIDTLSADMSGQLFKGSYLPISYQNSWRRAENENADAIDEHFQNTLGIGSRLGHFTNSIIWQKDLIKDPINDPLLDPLLDPSLDTRIANSTMGYFQYRKNFGRFHTRLFSDYGIKPTKEVYSYGGAFNYTFSSDLNTELRYTHYSLADTYQVNLGVNWRKDAFYLNTNAGYNEDGSWTAGIGLRFSLGYEPLERSIFTSSRPISQSGSVAVRVFEDTNMNGVFDADERPIENATVNAVQAYRQTKTNESGVAVISSLQNNSVTDIVVDESTLDEAFMIRAIPGVAIKARKGYVDTVDLPVVKAGEVEGVIYQKDKTGESVPAPYIMLNLVDKKDKVAASTRSEFDGYYLFTNVKPGTYHLTVDEEYIERKGLKEAKKPLAFSPKGDVIAGVDFELRPLDEAHGYIASAGHFSTPNMLKTYYMILRNKLGGQFIQTPFYIKQPNKQGYILGLAYFEGNPVTRKNAQLKALEACEKLAPYKIHCEVQYQDFKY